MALFKVLSRLLSYPTAELQWHLPEFVAYIDADVHLSTEVRQHLLQLIEQLAQQELMSLQSDYVNLFDRGRAVSLLLFEHVHGESRDRGQAMVDLLNLYAQHGLQLSVRELPDHLPLFLEFLGELPFSEAQELLAETTTILGMLAARLQERQSPYHAVFEALLCVVNAQVDMVTLRHKAAQEQPDDTFDAIDKIWEEEAVRFAGNPQRCGQDSEQPVHWVHASKPAQL
jgi:nitrate reductase delta subunit